MRAENPAALRFFLQDDIYLLPADKESIRAGRDQYLSGESPESASLIAEMPATEQPSIHPVEVQAEPVIPATTVIDEPVVQALVEEAVPVAKEAAPENPGFKYLGDFQKGFLIFTHYPDQEHIADTHLTALQSILKRKDYDTTDIAIYNLANNAIADMLSLARQFKPTRVLVLGKAAIPAGLESLALNQLKQFKTFNALFSYSFDEMMDNVEYKKAFWEQMKNL